MTRKVVSVWVSLFIGVFFTIGTLLIFYSQHTSAATRICNPGTYCNPDGYCWVETCPDPQQGGDPIVVNAMFNAENVNACKNSLHFSPDRTAEDTYQPTSIIIKRDGNTIATLPGDAVSYIDEGLTPGSRYSYSAVGLRRGGRIPKASNPPSITTPAISALTDTVTGLTATPVGGVVHIRFSTTQLLRFSPLQYIITRTNASGEVALFDGEAWPIYSPPSGNVYGFNDAGYDSSVANIYTVRLFNLPPGCAQNLRTLSAPYSVTVSPTPAPACEYNYSDWSVCESNAQTRSILSQTPEGCEGIPITSQWCPSPPTDYPPSISVTESGSSGTITLHASTFDDIGIARVDFYVTTGSDDIDSEYRMRGTDYDSTDAQYEITMDSRTLTDGLHYLKGYAYDTGGNIGYSSAVPFMVRNSPLSSEVLLAEGAILDPDRSGTGGVWCDENPYYAISWNYHSPSGVGQGSATINFYKANENVPVYSTTTNSSSARFNFVNPLRYIPASTPFSVGVVVRDVNGLASSEIKSVHTLTTPSYYYPFVQFVWAPVPAKAGWPITFSGASTLDRAEGATSRSRWIWKWNFDHATSTSGMDTPTSTAVFISATATSTDRATLIVTDNNGAQCILRQQVLGGNNVQPKKIRGIQEK